MALSDEDSGDGLDINESEEKVEGMDVGISGDNEQDREQVRS
jgi:hypothetical protein